MKGEKFKEFFRKSAVKAGCLVMAAVVLAGSCAWYEHTQAVIPELVTFVDMDETVTISEEEVPLASTKVTKATKTTQKTKKIKLKKASKKTYSQKGKTKTKTTTKKSSTTKASTTTKTVTATNVTNKFKKGSKIKTQVTTVKTTVTKTVTVKTTQKATATASKTASTQSSLGTGTYEASKAAPKADSRVLNAYSKLGFKVKINPNVSYSGLFDARTQLITLKKSDDTVYHELGHFLAFAAGNVDQSSSFKAVYNAEKSKYTASNKSYVLANSSEYFAESFKNYTLNPAALKASRPQTYAAIQSALNTLTDSHVSRLWSIYKSVWS